MFQHELFLRDKPQLLAEIRRATHYGVTPEKQEVDDLRSELGNLRLQVVDMDGRIDALSKMVDRLLEAAPGGGDEQKPKNDGIDIDPADTTKRSLENWTKKRRLDAVPDSTAGSGMEVRVDSSVADRVNATGPPNVNVEGRQEAGEEWAGIDIKKEGTSEVLVKAELTDEPVYKFPSHVESLAGDVVGSESGEDGAIIGGGPLCRGDTSFMRDLDNMSIGSVASVGSITNISLESLDLIDMTGSGNDNADEAEHDIVSGLNESFFDLDFEAEITSMTEHAGPTSPKQNGDGNAVFSDAVTEMPVTVSKDHAARIEELTASLDSMPPESRRKLTESLLALAQNPGVVSTLAATSIATTTVSTAGPSTTSAVAAAVPTASSAAGQAKATTPEIALPLASAALGAFMVHYAQAQAVKEPASAVAAVAMDPSRHALKRTASLR